MRFPMELRNNKVALGFAPDGKVWVWDRNWSPVPENLRNLRKPINRLMCVHCGVGAMTIRRPEAMISDCP